MGATLSPIAPATAAVARVAIQQVPAIGGDPSLHLRDTCGSGDRFYGSVSNEALFTRGPDGHFTVSHLDVRQAGNFCSLAAPMASMAHSAPGQLLSRVVPDRRDGNIANVTLGKLPAVRFTRAVGCMRRFFGTTMMRTRVGIVTNHAGLPLAFAPGYAGEPGTALWPEVMGRAVMASLKDHAPGRACESATAYREVHEAGGLSARLAYQMIVGEPPLVLITTAAAQAMRDKACEAAPRCRHRDVRTLRGLRANRKLATALGHLASVEPVTLGVRGRAHGMSLIGFAPSRRRGASTADLQVYDAATGTTHRVSRGDFFRRYHRVYVPQSTRLFERLGLTAEEAGLAGWDFPLRGPSATYEQAEGLGWVHLVTPADAS